MTWFLTRLGRPLKLSTDISVFSREVQKLRDKAQSILPPKLKAQVKERYDQAREGGLPDDLAHDISILPVLDSAFDIIRAALDQKADIVATAKSYFQTGEHFHMDWLREEAVKIPAHDRWSQESRDGLIDALYQTQTALSIRVMREAKAKGGGLQSWIDAHKAESNHIIGLLESMRNSGALDLSKLMIAVQKLQQLAG